MTPSTIELLDTRPTVYLRKEGGALRQLVRVTLRNGGAAIDGGAQVAVLAGERQQLCTLGAIPAGESAHDIFIDEAERPMNITFALRVGEGTLAQRIVPWQPPRHWDVHVVQTSHHDLGYTDLASNVLRVHDRWLDDALDMAQATADYPDDAQMRLVVEQAWSLEHYLRHARPERAARMIDLLRAGQFELNALYGNMTTELCSPEEIIRCLYPAFRLKREHGIPLVSAEHNDITGISWGLCQALTDAGIRFFAPGLPLYYNWGNLGLESFWDQRAVFGRDGPGAFWWEAPSGRRLLFWCNNTGCGGEHYADLPRLQESLVNIAEQGYPYDVLRWPVIGGARDNSPYSAGFVETIRAWNTQWAYPHLVSSTNARFLNAFETHLRGREVGRPADEGGLFGLPVHRGELPGQDYPVGATSTAAATAVNRNTHAAAIAAEKLATAASLASDYGYQAGTIGEVYEDMLLHDEHTWGHHFPAGPTAHAAQLEKSLRAHRGAALAHDVLTKAMARIADHVQAGGEGYPLVVFNMTGSARTDVVRAPLRELDNCGNEMVPAQNPRGAGYLRGVLLQDRWHFNLPPEVIDGHFTLVDASTGAPVPYQLIPIDADAAVPYAAERAGIGAGTPRYGIFEAPGGLKRDLCFIAAGVPAYGYKTYRLVPAGEGLPAEPGAWVTVSKLENEFYRIRFDRMAGGITSIVDKETGRELIDADGPHRFGALVVRDPYGAAWGPEGLKIRKGVNGPLAASVELTAAAHGHPAIHQTVTLYAGIRRIDVATRILKDATPLLDAHLAFPFKAARPAFRYEGVLAAMTPIMDYLPGSQSDRITVQNWVKVTDGEFNILWSSLDAPVASFARLWPGYVSPAHRCVVTADVKQHRRVTPQDLSTGWVYSDIAYNNLGTNFSVSQNGEMLFRYSITTRQGTVADGDAASFGWQSVTPLNTILALTSPRATLPPRASLVDVSGDQVVLLALKRAEDGHGLIARVWNMGQTETMATVQLPGVAVHEAWRANAVEENVDRLDVRDGRARAPVGGRDTATLRLIVE